MSHEATQLVASYFHMMREERRKPQPGEDRWIARIVEHARETERIAQADALETYERGLE